MCSSDLLAFPDIPASLAILEPMEPVALEPRDTLAFRAIRGFLAILEPTELEVQELPDIQEFRAILGFQVILEQTELVAQELLAIQEFRAIQVFLDSPARMELGLPVTRAFRATLASQVILEQMPQELRVTRASLATAGPGCLVIQAHLAIQAPLEQGQLLEVLTRRFNSTMLVHLVDLQT